MASTLAIAVLATAWLANGSKVSDRLGRALQPKAEPAGTFDNAVRTALQVTAGKVDATKKDAATATDKADASKTQANAEATDKADASKTQADAEKHAVMATSIQSGESGTVDFPTGSGNYWDNINFYWDIAPGQGEYVGCYADNNNARDLPHQIGGGHARTKDQCLSECNAAGYKYAGKQFQNQCWCGNSYGSHGVGTTCDCSSTTNQGANVNCVYKTAQANTCTKIKLTFTHLGIESHSSCGYDWLKVLKGTTEVAKVCGSAIPGPYEVDAKSVKLEFRSDGSSTGSGFVVNYVATCATPAPTLAPTPAPTPPTPAPTPHIDPAHAAAAAVATSSRAAAASTAAAAAATSAAAAATSAAAAATAARKLYADEKVVAHWMFDDLTDSTGNFGPLTITGAGAVSNGYLNLDNTGKATAVWNTGPVLTNKTLVAWLKIDNLATVGGSPLCIERTVSPADFDAIVWAELVANKWFAGSGDHHRSKNPTSVTVAETSAGTNLMIAVTYGFTSGNNVQVTLYRNEQQLEKFTTTNGDALTWTPATAGTQALFGPRVSPNHGAVDMKVYEARIYGKELSANDITTLSRLSYCVGNVCPIFK